ncbi:ankyrin repeat domain-containing protein [Clostridium sp. 'deep sea']|uniref:ankyrin repeat domain-containing protein n=1 Tax=Clostridium sp. 'deep sea' TaxID=2779445 RepID=UPI00189682AD|nr:ankyrin repeat domain-containing protein [Clostridium sp. 'deep sea']QOR34308.1 ankyrin repeat domain-containing protein [Clostridium sp. 'deep sea']
MKSLCKYLLIMLAFFILLTGCELVQKSQLKNNGYQFTHEDFINSIKMGNKKVVSIFVELGADVNKLSNHDKSPLYYATSVQNPEIMQMLIDSGANVNSADSPLVIACKRNNTITIDLLLKNGAKLSNNPIPLLVAVESRSISTAEFLLKQGANPNIANSPMPIQLAIENEDIDMINLLTQYETDINKIKALAIAITTENLNVIETLLKNGADPNCCKEVLPLQLAIDIGDFEIFTLLAEYGANLNNIANNGFFHKQLFKLGYQNNSKGYIASLEDGNYDAIEIYLKEGFDPNLNIKFDNYPLLIVASHNEFNLIKLLIEHGADPNVHSEYNLITALSIVINKGNLKIIDYLLVKGANPSFAIANAVAGNDIALVKYLIKHGASADAGYPREAFIIACDNENYEIIDLLLNNGANIECQAEFNFGPYSTSLEIATYNSNLKLMEYLIGKGANYDRCLNYAIAGNSLEATKYLLAIGANPDVKNDLFIPILFSVQNNKLDFVKVLIDYGADINIQNNQGKTALDIAIENNYHDIIELLKNT